MLPAEPPPDGETPAAARAAESVPEVTVIIPSKDRPVLVERAVAVACSQQGVDLEVIVIDDGSTPPVDLQSKDPRVRVLRNEPARGVAAARNRGVFEARAPWVAFLDDDDLWAPAKLRTQLDACAEWGAQWCHPSTYWLNGAMGLRFINHPPARWTSREVLLGANVVGSPSGVLASTELVRAVGGFDGAFSTFADWDLWLRLADAYPALGVRAPLLGYVTHEGSMHRQPLGPLLRELRLLTRRHRGRGRLGGVEIWVWIAMSKKDAGQHLFSAAIAIATGLRWARAKLFVDAAKALVRMVFPRRREPQPWRAAPDWIAQWQAADETEADR